MITLQQFIDISKECGFDCGIYHGINYVTSNNCVGVTWTVCAYCESDSTIEFCDGPFSYPGGFCYRTTGSDKIVDIKKYTVEQLREFLLKCKQREKAYIKEFRLKKIEEL